MTDIVERLRSVDMIPGANANLCHEAADEIERLRRQLGPMRMGTLRDNIDRLTKYEGE